MTELLQRTMKPVYCGASPRTYAASSLACGQLTNRLADLVYPTKQHLANERFAQHLWKHRNELFTFLKFPTIEATNWLAEHAIRFGVILRKVWGGNRTWAGARAQAVLMSVWRTCWQQGRSALDFLSCEPTAHRFVSNVLRPPAHHLLECLRAPTAAAWLDVG